MVQKGHSNLMHCSYRKAAYSITYTMRHVAGHSSDGIKLVRLPVRIATCKCAALPCCCHAASHCSRALNSFAVQSISKVCITEFAEYSISSTNNATISWSWIRICHSMNNEIACHQNARNPLCIRTFISGHGLFHRIINFVLSFAKNRQNSSQFPGLFLINYLPAVSGISRENNILAFYKYIVFSCSLFWHSG